MTDDIVNKRLDRIEYKIDQIQTVLISIARIEERQSQSGDEMRINTAKIDALTKRMDKIEKNVDQNSTWSSIWAKSAWIVAAAALGGLATKYLGA